MNPITGSLVAIITPMHEDGSLDLPGMRRLVDYHIQEGTDAIVVVGTTGESPTVDVDEHHEIIKTVVEQVAGRIPVIAGTGANSTSEAVEMNRFAKSIGAMNTVYDLMMVKYVGFSAMHFLKKNLTVPFCGMGLLMTLQNVNLWKKNLKH